ncbi:MAG: SpaA isopeptide-forming pilin-related protein [Turicibacter sp.]|nr:SpaA isopeptide-forming pilin-related protein [Turicibacter sp.]
MKKVKRRNLVLLLILMTTLTLQSYLIVESWNVKLAFYDSDDQLEGDTNLESSEDNEAGQNEGNTALEVAREELSAFLTYLNETLFAEDFEAEQWSEWQALITRAQVTLAQSPNIDEIRDTLTKLMEWYESHQRDDDLAAPQSNFRLLSLTRQEFESMTTDEIVEMAEEGGYANVEVLPLATSRARSGGGYACQNLDGNEFVANVIVDGMVCISGSDSLARTPTPVDAPANFVAAWNNNNDVTNIVLMNNITIPQGTLFAGRTASVRLESNTDRNTLTLTGASTVATNPFLLLGAAPTGRSTLELNNIRFSRTHTQTGTTAAPTNNRNRASGRNIFSVEVTGDASTPTAAGRTNSQNWDIVLHDDVVTGTTGTTLAAVNNISGLIKAPLATLTVAGTGNQLNMFANGAAGTDYLTHQIDVRDFEMLPDSELIVHSQGSAAANLHINDDHTESGTAENTVITVTQPGRVVLREGAALTIDNNGIRVGQDAPITTGAISGTEHRGRPWNGHGLYGFISTFTMEGGSTLDITSVGVGFRSRSSTTYTMTDGAVKTVLARRTSTATNDTQGRPAFVLADNYLTGSWDVAVATRRDGLRRNRAAFSHDITITGEGTKLVLEGHSNDNTLMSPNRGNLMVMGDHSTFTVSDGAALRNLSHSSTAMLFFGEGTIFNVNTEGIMNIEVRGSAHADAGAFRFLQSGSQTFYLDTEGEVNIIATAGTAGLLRAYGGNNAFYVDGGGLLNLQHRGPIGTVARGIDFASGNTHETDHDRFIVNGYRSEVRVVVNRGVAVDGDTGSSITRVEAGPGTVFVIEANAHGDDGVFNAGDFRLMLNAPLFFDFQNTSSLHQAAPTSAMNRGLLFNTNANSIIVGTNTDLALWRNTRVEGFGTATANAGATPDALRGDPGQQWSNMNFTLQPNSANFANGNLVANGGSTSEPRFQNWFNGPGLTRHVGTGTGTSTLSGGANHNYNNAFNNGWRQIRRMTANNATPVVDILRIPTDADQRIFGHVSIPEGNRGARSAFTNEVFVDLIIRNENHDLVQRINNIPTGRHSVFGSEEHMGVFMAEIDFSVGFEAGTTFLPANYTIEVVRARRASIENPDAPSTLTTNSETPGNITNYRETRGEQDVLTGQKIVYDVTPPEQVTDVTGLISGNERFNGAVTTATTSIRGTGEPGAIVRIGRVTPATGVVTSVSWLAGTAEVDEYGEWEFTIPNDMTLLAGERLSIYISDDERLTEIQTPPLRQVIFRPDPNDTTIDTRAIVSYIDIANLRTANTASWAGSNIGNINYHYNQRTPFHDANFDYAYVLTVMEVVEVDFRWNFEDAPDEGRFHLEAILAGQTVSEPIPPPTRENYHFLGWTTDPDAVDGPYFNFDTPITEDTTLYAQWIGLQSFRFIKVSDQGHVRLEGAEFTVRRRVDDACIGDPIAEPFVSDEQGVVHVQGLDISSQYCLVETSAPDHHYLSQGYWIITVSADGEIGRPTPVGGAPAFESGSGLANNEENLDLLMNEWIMPPVTGVVSQTGRLLIVLWLLNSLLLVVIIIRRFQLRQDLDN